MKKDKQKQINDVLERLGCECSMALEELEQKNSRVSPALLEDYALSIWALEKQKIMDKIETEDGSTYCCPCCNLEISENDYYCKMCGQNLGRND